MSQTVRRVVLLGFMCSGKSTVGAALARRLDWEFVDLDAEIEHRTGYPVKALVASEGVGALRAMEAALTAELAGRTELVIAPGGGWIGQPELLAALGEGTLSVWLRAPAAELVRRIRADPAPRPLRGRRDAEAVVARLLEEREPLYRLAGLELSTEGLTPDEVALRIASAVRAAAPE